MNTLKIHKMEKINILPENYIPINELNVCSNRIMGGGSVIGINNISPLIIGQGNIPMIWLYSRIDRSNWLPLVVESRSKHANIDIIENQDEREITIKFNDIILISSKMLNDNSNFVNQIDLRPIGIDLHGDSNRLMVSGNNFSGNTFNGISFMIGFK